MLTDQDYELLSAYIDDALTEGERATLDGRLRAETELRRELEALRGTVALLNALPARKAPRDFTLDARMARRPAVRRLVFSTVGFSAISALAAVFLIGFSLVLLSGQNAPRLASAPVSNGGGAPQPVQWAGAKALDVGEFGIEELAAEEAVEEGTFGLGGEQGGEQGVRHRGVLIAGSIAELDTKGSSHCTAKLSKYSLVSANVNGFKLMRLVTRLCKPPL